MSSDQKANRIKADLTRGLGMIERGLIIIARKGETAATDPTLTNEENAATGPIVSFDLGAFREEAGAESFNSFTRGGLRHFVESFVISDRSFREVGEWSEWEDSRCGKQTRSKEVLLKNGAKTFRGQVRDKPPKVYSDRFGDEPQSLPEEITLDKAEVNAAGPWIDASEPPEEDGLYLIKDIQAPDDYRCSYFRDGKWGNPLTTHYAIMNAPEGS